MCTFILVPKYIHTSRNDTVRSHGQSETAAHGHQRGMYQQVCCLAVKRCHRGAVLVKYTEKPRPATRSQATESLGGLTYASPYSAPSTRRICLQTHQLLSKIHLKKTRQLSLTFTEASSGPPTLYLSRLLHSARPMHQPSATHVTLTHYQE